MRRLALKERVAPIVVVLAAYAVLLGRLSAEDDVLVTVPLIGRRQTETLSMIGFFTSFALLRARLDDAPSFRTVIARANAALNEAKAMEGVPYGFIAELAGQHGQRPPWLAASANLVGVKEDEEALEIPNGTVTKTTVSVPAARATLLSRYDLNLLLKYRHDGSMGASFRYRTALCDAAAAASYGRHFVALLGRAMDTPDVRTRELADHIDRHA
jgi:non-ribosomal peptide synthetase component F